MPPRDATVMVVLASEQLWPNIHGLVHWQSQLRHLCIYHTSDARVSAGPARSLAALCRTLYPGVEVHLPERAGGLRPEDVEAQVCLWRRQLPDGPWLLNASGGNKLMSTGLLAFVGTPGMSVVYRERMNEWFEFRRGPSGGLTTEPFPVPAEATDAVPVEALVRAVWETPDISVQFERPTPLPVLELTRAVVAANGNWAKAFQDAGVPLAEQPRVGAGILFERFVAAVLLELGVKNLICSVKRRWKDREDQALQEVDLVANRGGRLVIVDAKLRTAEEEVAGRVEAITSQVRQAAVTRRDLGGLRGSLLLLRPNRPLDEGERALADAYQLTVLDQHGFGDFFQALASFVGADLPPPLQQAHELLRARARHPLTRVLAPEAPEVALLAPPRRGQPACRALIDLDYALDVYAREHRQDWSAFLTGGTVRFKCANPDNLTRAELEDRVARLLAGIGKPEEFVLSNSGKSCWFDLLSLDDARRAKLVRRLEPYVGRSLLGRSPRP